MHDKYRVITKLKDIIQGKAPLSATRSPHWAAVRLCHLKNHPVCAVCEGRRALNVHHIRPFHIHPELELDPTNLISLCECLSYGVNCHLLIGHLGNFKGINPNVVEDAAVWNKKIKESLSNDKEE